MLISKKHAVHFCWKCLTADQKRNCRSCHRAGVRSRSSTFPQSIFQEPRNRHAEKYISIFQEPRNRHAEKYISIFREARNRHAEKYISIFQEPRNRHAEKYISIFQEPRNRHAEKSDQHFEGDDSEGGRKSERPRDKMRNVFSWRVQSRRSGENAEAAQQKSRGSLPVSFLRCLGWVNGALASFKCFPDDCTWIFQHMQ